MLRIQIERNSMNVFKFLFFSFNFTSLIIPFLFPIAKQDDSIHIMVYSKIAVTGPIERGTKTTNVVLEFSIDTNLWNDIKINDTVSWVLCL